MSSGKSKLSSLTLVAATGNRHKLDELRTVAAEFGVSLLAPAALVDECGPPPEVEESADSYFGNALLKAQAYAAWSGRAVLADDSGLEVAALGNRPGTHSARYGGAATPHAKKMQLLLHELDHALARDPKADRSARFVCVLAAVVPGHPLFRAEGILEGYLLEEPQGDGGFGYDPIVFIPSLGATLAEVDFETTCRHGFRAKAVRSLLSQLAAALEPAEVP